MKTNIKLSVVVPVYNGAAFITRCLDCLINQSLEEMQIYLVDDGSTDKTIQIASHYESGTANLTILRHQQNRGTGAARNTGLAAVNSAFVAFLDADDWIDTNAYLEMVSSMETTGADVSICGIKTEYSNVACSNWRYYYPYRNLLTGKFALKMLSRVEQQDIFISPMVGNKVFRTDFLRHYSLEFSESSLYEDDEFMFLALCHSSRVSLVPTVCQHYFQREMSAMHMFSKGYIDSFLNAFQNIKMRLQEEDLFETFQNEYFAFLDKCLSSLLDTLFSCEQSVGIQRQYISYLLEGLLQSFTIQELIAHIEPCRLQRLWL